MKELGVWVELTTLVIPAFNDSDETISGIIDFIKSVDQAVPWHVTRFYPTYKLLDQPGTPVDTLRLIRNKGLKQGLKYVYVGNVPGEGGENTYCPKCKEMLVERVGYNTVNRIQKGSCYNCEASIDGVWS
jgi:pyruvate formate lyase activating enzyme